MKKKLILHIGCEKTGTTSIQNSLFLNRKLLLKSEGILYPQSLGKRNHTKLAIYTCSDDKNLTRFLFPDLSLDKFRQQVRQDFIQELANSDAERVIISNEWLHPRVRHPDEFNRLKSLLDEVADKVEIVLYVRRQDKLAMSLYSTSLKAGNYKRFSFPSISDGKLPYYYDFLSIYRNWKSFFGAGNIQVRVFDRENLFKKDVVMDFLSQVLGVSVERIRFYQEDNHSVNMVGVHVMRKLNYLLHSLRKCMRPRTARMIRHFVANKFKGKPRLATKSECDAFMEWFHDNNLELEREYASDTQRAIKLL